MSEPLDSGQVTARKAAVILVAKQCGFIIPTALQKQNLLMAFARTGKAIYGKAFDVVRMSKAIDLDSLEAVESNLSDICLCEIKSTRKKIKPDFSGYFFALTAGEVLVAQSLKEQFRFVLVNTLTGDFAEFSLPGIFARAKGIYPTWSISF